MAKDINLSYDTAREITLDFLRQCKLDCIANQEAIKEDFRNGEMVLIQLADYTDSAENIKQLEAVLDYLGDGYRYESLSKQAQVSLD